MRHIDDDATRWDKIARQQQRRDRPVTEPMRTGSDRHALLSLDAPGADTIAAPEPELVVDWSSLSGLTRIETRAVTHSLKHGVPDYRLHEPLGVTRREALQALHSGLEKLRRDPAGVGFCALSNSRRLAFREKLHSGARPWALSKLDSAFNRIMQGERTYFRSHYQEDASVVRKRTFSLPVKSESTHMKTIKQLQQNVDDTEKNHARVCERLHNSRVAREEADSALSLALAAVEKEQAAAVLEDRAPDIGSLTKRIANLRTDLQAREADLKAAAAARVLSEAAANEAKFQMECQRKDAARAAVAALLDEYWQGQDAQAERQSRILAILGKHGFGSGLMVPPNINDLPAAERDHWRARCAAINADYAMHVARDRWPELTFRSA